MGLYPVIRRVGREFEQMFVDGPYILVYRNVVVIYDYKQVSLAASCIVQTFECQPSAECTVSYQRHHLFVQSAHHGCGSQAEGR